LPTNFLHYFRPSVASVPVYDDDSAREKRKVQRITSPEKWEIKQVGMLHYIYSTGII
jgi:hypothetical protein